MLYPLSFQVRSELEQHLDVDHESLVGDQSGSVDNSLEEKPVHQGANNSQSYPSLDEGKSINV